MFLWVEFSFFSCLYAANLSAVVGFFRLVGNGLRYETLGFSELRTYPPTPNPDARQNSLITTYPPMFYDRLLGTGDLFFYHFNSICCNVSPCVWVGELFGWFWPWVGFLSDQTMCLTTKRGN